MTSSLRPDMSEWLLHFIHDRNSKNEPIPEDLFGEGAPDFFPANADSKKNDRYVDFFINEHECASLDADATAFQILNKILDQGLLRSGWSFRNGRATIYGPRSAVCFTEMPLSSLLAYARERGDERSVGKYAVGLLKSELYMVGGRPVLYGLTRQHQEVSKVAWPRFLAPECGIGEYEQYRYVPLKLGAFRNIDWTHEREWRWADHEDKIDIPGLPIWRANGVVQFSRALVVVQTEQEAVEVLSHLRRCLDSNSDIFGNAYNKDLLKATYVVSLEQLEKAKLLGPDAMLTVEQIPHHLLQPIPMIPASAEAKIQVRRVLQEAVHAAGVAAAEWRKGGDRDACGFAELVIDDGLAEFTRAGLEMGLLKPFAGIDPFGSGGYWVEGVSSVCEMQGLGEAESASEAAKKVIERNFPELPMHVWTRWD